MAQTDKQEKHCYEIDLKQGDLFIQLISDDILFVAKQMERWLGIMFNDNHPPVSTPVISSANKPKDSAKPVEPSPVTSIMSSVESASLTNVSATSSIFSSPDREQQLIDEIRQLQLQIQALAQQALVPKSSESITQTISIKESLIEHQDSSPLSQSSSVLQVDMSFSQPLAEGVLSAETDSLDAFVLPAHSDMEGEFDTFKSVQPEQHATVSGFEQAVNNSSISVNNPSSISIEQPGETIAEEGIKEEVISFQQVVNKQIESHVPSVENSPLPVINKPDNNLELLIDSIVTDLGEIKNMQEETFDNIVVETSPSSVAKNKDIFEEQLLSIFHSETSVDIKTTPVTEPEPEQIVAIETEVKPVNKMDELAKAMEKSIRANLNMPYVESVEQNNIEPEPEQIVATETEVKPVNKMDELAKSMEKSIRSNLQSRQIEQSEEESFTDDDLLAAIEIEKHNEQLSVKPSSVLNPLNAFDEELEGLFDDSSSSSAVKTVKDTIPAYAPPQVNYDFGIPPPDPSQDPELQKLSLSTLDNRGGSYESPFPQPDGENSDDSTESSLQVKPDKTESYKTAEESHIETFSDLCDLALQTKNPQDYLMLTAYFLTNYKKIEKYTLKDLNTQLMKSGLTPLNHGMLESAISMEYIQLLPDLTGTANAAEYRITSLGQAYAKNLIQD